jgi:hypothetical protein
MPTEFRHPQYDLDQSIDVARRITGRGAGAAVSGPELAAYLGYSSTNNGAYLTRVAAARLFGLIEGRSDAISATERATRIIHPDYPETAERARLEAFRAVPLYSAFLEAFRGRPLPDENGMVNTLVGRFQVAERDAKPALARLLSSAEQAGLFRVAGSGRMIEPTIAASAPPTKDEPTEDESPQRPPTPVAYGGGARQFPKIIEGALDLMPAGPPWDEAEYAEWLDFFDKACRVYYRIKRGARTGA